MTRTAHVDGRRTVLLIAGVFLMLVTIHRSGGAVMANELISLGHSPSEVATVISALFLSSALFQLPTGLLFDRYGASRTICGLGFLGVIGIALFAMSDSVTGLAAGRLLIGIGHGGTIAGIYLLSIGWVAPDRVASTTGAILAIAGGAGSILATTPLVISLHSIGHRGTFLAVAAVTLLVTLAIGRFVRDAAPGREPPGSGSETFAESLRGLWQVATDRKLWPIYAMGSCFAVSFNAVGGLWAGPYLLDVHAMSKEQASLGVLVLVVCYHLGNLAYGAVERGIRTRKWTVVGGVLIMIVALSLLAASSSYVFVVAIGLMAIVCLCAPFYPVLAAHLRGFVPLGRAGRAIACVNLIGLTVLFAVQVFTGWLVAITSSPAGKTTAFSYQLVFACIAIILMLGLAGYLKARDVPP